MRIAPALIVMALLASPAAAQSDLAAEHFLVRRAFPDCALSDFRVRFRGALAGLDEPAVVATYDVEGCLGGNNSIQGVAVFLRRGGRIVMLRPRLEAPLSVETARVEEGRVVAEAMRWAPGDAQCCPSQRVAVRFAMREGRLVQDGPPVPLPER